MISITIEDDGKVSLKTTNGVIETKTASAIVVEAMKNLFNQNTRSKLMLVSYDPTSKLHAVKNVKEALGLGLKESKDIVDACTRDNKIVLSSGTRSDMEKLSLKFDPTTVQVEVINDDKEWV